MSLFRSFSFRVLVIFLLLSLATSNVLSAKDDSCTAASESTTCVDEDTAAESTTKKMGFEKVLISAGSGAKPKKGDKVTVHCTGYGKNGNLSVPFWSTKDPGGTPFTFQIGLGMVIKAWDEGVMTMAIGEKAMIKATADYAYGASGFAAWGILVGQVVLARLQN